MNDYETSLQYANECLTEEAKSVQYARELIDAALCELNDNTDYSDVSGLLSDAMEALRKADWNRSEASKTFDYIEAEREAEGTA